MLPYDVLLHLLEFSDANQLFHVSLVSQEWNSAASKLLYSSVTLSPHFSSQEHDNNGLPSCPSQFMSALSPKYATFVRELRVGGFLSKEEPSRNELYRVLQEALKSFTSLQAVAFLPKYWPDDLFREPLKLLQSCHSLKILAINSSCFDDELALALAISPADNPSALASIAEGEEDEEEDQFESSPPPLTKAELVSRITGLTTLTLSNPTRKILQVLIPYWLSSLSDTLLELYLLHNCGSVTPGVLSSALPHLQTIRALSIGLSYSLTDHHVFTSLAQLPCLQTLALNYYTQHTSPPRFPALRALKSFTVRYPRPETLRESERIAKWVRKAICHSPIESLSLVEDPHSIEHGSNPNFDGLIHHLVSVHSARLKNLDLRACFIGRRALEKLCLNCTKLDSLKIAGGREILHIVQNTKAQGI
ncbi:hypothetical protein L218DRAFT_432966 [Marasmius fiardii PR-910]|nr:hypothetical protein L218DRAFT_432966 [Marasmius fiardii PR-910]